ncbi:hypothetical protein Q7W17_00130 [Streptococcus suis]|nr:hypothetical protein [Streptococcus suis]
MEKFGANLGRENYKPLCIKGFRCISISPAGTVVVFWGKGGNEKWLNHAISNNLVVIFF